MIYRQDSRYYGPRCYYCGGGRLDHDAVHYDRCMLILLKDYERKFGYHARRREDDAMLDAVGDRRVR